MASSSTAFEKQTRKGALLDMVFMNKEELVMAVKVHLNLFRDLLWIIVPLHSSLERKSGPGQLDDIQRLTLNSRKVHPDKKDIK